MVAQKCVAVADAQRAVDQKVKLPPGYSMTWGGQFKNLQEATGRLMIAVPLALLMIVALLYLVFDTAKLALLIFLTSLKHLKAGSCSKVT